MKLYLDTSNNLQTLVKLDAQEYIKKYENPRDQDVLGAIVEALGLESKTMTDIESIDVATGPGSFTGLRVGIAIANTLGWSLNIPVNNQDIGTPILPEYGKAPSITKSSKNTPK